jgi:4,5-DOPA dioxygenase extradiol
MTQQMPSLFLSHGAPSLVLEDCPARHFLEQLGRQLPRPSAIVVMSAHYEASAPSIGAAPHPETIYDFRGFPEALYQMTYPALGAPELAKRMQKMLCDAGLDAKLDDRRGLDHGIWNPLKLIYPAADIPVVPLSIDPLETPQFHARIGEILSPLREDGVLIIGSGSITHNLQRFFGGQYKLDSPAAPFAQDFADWISDRAAEGDTETLLATPDTWPKGRENHPTDDHILPFYFTLGAAGKNPEGTRLHRSTNYGVLAMDAYAFGPCQIV